MTVNSRTFAFGTLEENGDTWLPIARDQMIILDLALSYLSLEYKTVRVTETMGVPSSTPGILKPIVEKLGSHDDIVQRIYGIDRSSRRGAVDENWFQIERELLANREQTNTGSSLPLRVFHDHAAPASEGGGLVLRQAVHPRSGLCGSACSENCNLDSRRCKTHLQ